MDIYHISKPQVPILCGSMLFLCLKAINHEKTRKTAVTSVHVYQKSWLSITRQSTTNTCFIRKMAIVYRLIWWVNSCKNNQSIKNRFNIGQICLKLAKFRHICPSPADLVVSGRSGQKRSKIRQIWCCQADLVFTVYCYMATYILN